MAVEDDKLPGLEAARFLSALAILFWHYQHFFYIANKPENFVRTRQPFYEPFALFYEHGHLAVLLFWGISGFIFFWKYRDAIASRAISAYEFFVRRLSRLYPLHLVTLCLVAVLQYFYFAQNATFYVYQNNDLKHFLLQLCFASNWLPKNGFSFNGPIWSISVEVLVYSVFFVVLRHISRSSFVNIVVLCLYLLAKLHSVFMPVLDCLAFFYIGGLTAIAFRRFESTAYHGWLNVGAVSVSIILMGIAPTFAPETDGGRHLLMLSVVPGLLYLLANRLPITRQVQAHLVSLGNLTYASYLLHFPFQIAIALVYSLAHKELPYYEPAFLVGYLSISLLAAHLVYRYFEQPMQDLLRATLAK